METAKVIHARQHEITETFLRILDRHLLDLVEGRVADMYEIRDVAKEMHIHPTHLTDTVRHATGHHPCVFYQEKILAIAMSMLQQPGLPISHIALTLTYDPSNFTKFFKRFTAQTPRQYREAFFAAERRQLSETVTI